MELDFPLEEYQGRVRRIQGKMQERGLDALCVLSPELIHYVCGYDPAWLAPLAEFSGVIIPATGEHTLLVRSLESKTTRRQAAPRVRLYLDWQGPWDFLKEILGDAGAAKGAIGIDENAVTARKLDRLKAILPEARIVYAGGLVESLMAEPSPLEIEFTRKAGAITKAGFRRALDTIREGVPLYHVLNEVQIALYEAGMTEQRLTGMYILNLIWAGPEGGEMHETDVTRKLQKGDLVCPEIWGTYKHYVAGAQGTIHVGDSPSREIVSTYEVLSAMYVAARDAMKVGVTVGDAWEAGNKPYRAAYGSDYYRILGPQQGSSGFLGRLGRGVTDPLRPGAAYLVQPQVNDPLLITVAATAMVTEQGTEELTEPLLKLVTV